MWSYQSSSANTLFSLHKKHICNLLARIWGLWLLVLWSLRKVGCLHVRLSGKMYLHNLCEISDVAEKTTRTSWGREEHFIWQPVARKMLYPRFIVTEKMLYRCQTTNSSAAENINAWISSQTGRDIWQAKKEGGCGCVMEMVSLFRATWLGGSRERGGGEQQEQCPHLSSGRGKTLSLVIQSCPPHGRFFFGGLWIITLARRAKGRWPVCRKEDAFVFIALFTLGVHWE